MREAGGPSTEVVELVLGLCTPHRDSHARTMDAPAQRYNGVNLRGTLEVGYKKSAATLEVG
jgi:hypothetical protein